MISDIANHHPHCVEFLIRMMSMLHGLKHRNDLISSDENFIISSDKFTRFEFEILSMKNSEFCKLHVDRAQMNDFDLICTWWFHCFISRSIWLVSFYSIVPKKGRTTSTICVNGDEFHPLRSCNILSIKIKIIELIKYTYHIEHFAVVKR